MGLKADVAVTTLQCSACLAKASKGLELLPYAWTLPHFENFATASALRMEGPATRQVRPTALAHVYAPTGCVQAKTCCYGPLDSSTGALESPQLERTHMHLMAISRNDITPAQVRHVCARMGSKTNSQIRHLPIPKGKATQRTQVPNRKHLLFFLVASAQSRPHGRKLIGRVPCTQNHLSPLSPSYHFFITFIIFYHFYHLSPLSSFYHLYHLFITFTLSSGCHLPFTCLSPLSPLSSLSYYCVIFNISAHSFQEHVQRQAPTPNANAKHYGLKLIVFLWKKSKQCVRSRFIVVEFLS